MARYPGASWRPLANNWSAQPRMARHDLVVLHTMVGSLTSTDSYFRNDGYGGPESHFGVGHDGTVYQWQDCVEASTRVLCADMTWRPAGSLVLGDEIVGIDEYPQNGGRRRLRRAVVTGNGLRQDELYEVRTDRGVVRCNGKHPWLAKSNRRDGRRGAWTWVRTDELTEDHKLYHLMEPWDFTPSWETGWLAGFLDGEGCLSRSGHGVTLSCNQRTGDLADRMVRAIKGFTDSAFELVRDYDGARKPMLQVQINRVPEILRLLGQVRPHRLLDQADKAWVDQSTIKMVTAVPVRSVTRVGLGTISLLGSSTATYVAEGFVVHNTAYKAEANGVANSRAISIETADMGTGFPKWDTRSGNAVPAWTDDQCEAIARIIAWSCDTHDIPCVTIPDSRPERRGVGYHRLGVPGYVVPGGELWSSAQGKVCPGPKRIAQIPGIVARAQSLLKDSVPIGEDHVLENHRVEGAGNIRLIFPVGRASGILAAGWVSAAVDGDRPGVAHIFFQGDHGGISDVRWDLSFKDGHSARPWAVIPDGTTMVNINYDFPDGGVIALEGRSK